MHGAHDEDVSNGKEMLEKVLVGQLGYFCCKMKREKLCRVSKMKMV